MNIASHVTQRRISQLQEHQDNEVYNSRLTDREEAALKASIAEHGIQEGA